MSAVTRSASAPEPLSPTTGEPVSTPARRNRLGIWLCIVSDATGTVALLVAYAYLWSLTVNSAWATYWLALATAFHLFLLLFLVTAILNRTRRGLITVANPYHARLVAMWVTWICVAAFLGALFATTMTVSPNLDSPSFGTFQE